MALLVFALFIFNKNDSGRGLVKYTPEADTAIEKKTGNNRLRVLAMN